MAYASSENTPASNKPPQAKSPAKKEPVKKLEGKKWIIENAEGNWDLQVEMDQRVHIISSTGKTVSFYKKSSFWLNLSHMTHLKTQKHKLHGDHPPKV